MEKFIETLLCPSFGNLYQGDRDKFIARHLPLSFDSSGGKKEENLWNEQVDVNDFLVGSINGSTVDSDSSQTRIYQVAFHGLDLEKKHQKLYYLGCANNYQEMQDQLLQHAQMKTFLVTNFQFRYVHVPKRALKQLLWAMIDAYQDHLPYNTPEPDIKIMLSGMKTGMGSITGRSSIRRRSMLRSSVSSLTASDLDSAISSSGIKLSNKLSDGKAGEDTEDDLEEGTEGDVDTDTETGEGEDTPRKGLEKTGERKKTSDSHCCVIV